MSKDKRRYIRCCGICGERDDQSEMIRDDCSPNGWICLECFTEKHPEYDEEEF